MIDRALYTNGQVADVPVPIGPEQTCPTERMAILLADLCQLTPDATVLEIGTGSGYQAAILAERCKEVVSIEVAPLARVPERLPSNVTLVVGDGSTYDTGEQFDAVLVTFAAGVIAPNWVKQVKEGGRLVVPVVCGDVCRIAVSRKVNGKMSPFTVIGYAPFTEQKCNSLV